MIPAKLATLSFRKIKVFSNEVYDVIISVHDVTNKILSHESNGIINLIMRPKFGNSSISMSKVIITSILEGFDQKNTFLALVLIEV